MPNESLYTLMGSGRGGLPSKDMINKCFENISEWFQGAIECRNAEIQEIQVHFESRTFGHIKDADKKLSGINNVRGDVAARLAELGKAVTNLGGTLDKGMQDFRNTLQQSHKKHRDASGMSAGDDDDDDIPPYDIDPEVLLKVAQRFGFGAVDESATDGTVPTADA